jgi:hypothetical protein
MPRLRLLAACTATGSKDTATDAVDTERPAVVDTEVVASDTIGPEGGTVVSPDGVFSLEVPPGALSEHIESPSKSWWTTDPSAAPGGWAPTDSPSTPQPSPPSNWPWRAPAS